MDPFKFTPFSALSSRRSICRTQPNVYCHFSIWYTKDMREVGGDLEGRNLYGSRKFPLSISLSERVKESISVFFKQWHKARGWIGMMLHKKCCSCSCVSWWRRKFLCLTRDVDGYCSWRLLLSAPQFSPRSQSNEAIRRWRKSFFQ
jgi:hypothetical protein